MNKDNPDYITWSQWFRAWFYGIQVAFWIGYSQLVTRFKWLLRLQLPISDWVTFHFQRALDNMDRILNEKK